jgi:hypothetical protein
LNDEALRLIEAKALQRGADAVLGLRVDHDEISGSGKSMLMVTASGTAVRAHRILRADAEASGSVNGRAVTAEEMQALLSRRDVLKRAEADALNWEDEESWRFIVEHRIDEMAPQVQPGRGGTVCDPFQVS